ncbi:AAA family ATPase [Patescibacteria group bacterium]
MQIHQELINKVMKELGLRKVTGADISDEQNEFLSTLPPIITVSRNPGSGGRPIAKLVAEKLGFKYYNQELVNEIARSAKMRKNLLSEVDEKGRSLMTDFVHGMLNPDYISDVEYMRHLCKVVLTIAYKGKAVILGRGANFITPFASGLHVRVTAPKRVRLRRAIQYEGLSETEAKKVLNSTEKDRKNFIKQYFDKKIGDPEYYDLILNTSFYNLDQSARVIKKAFEQKFTKGTM